VFIRHLLLCLFFVTNSSFVSVLITYILQGSGDNRQEFECYKIALSFAFPYFDGKYIYYCMLYCVLYGCMLFNFIPIVYANTILLILIEIYNSYAQYKYDGEQ